MLFDLTKEQCDLLCTVIMHAQQSEFVCGVKKDDDESRMLESLFNYLHMPSE